MARDFAGASLFHRRKNEGLRPPFGAPWYNRDMSEPADRSSLETRWQRNEIELRRLANAPGLERELNAARIDELLGEQDSIEYALGSASPSGPRRWSGLL
jgi:hypothetical protein